MPNVAEIKNICVYLQANNYTIQLYLYTDRKMTKERKQEREKKSGGGNVTKMLIYLTNVKSKTAPKVVENCLLYVVTNTQYPLKHLLTKEKLLVLRLAFLADRHAGPFAVPLWCCYL